MLCSTSSLDIIYVSVKSSIACKFDTETLELLHLFYVNVMFMYVKCAW